jgi:hypothetical protein
MHTLHLSRPSWTCDEPGAPLTGALPTSHRSGAQPTGDPLSVRFGRPLPPGLREEATGMTLQAFTTEYASGGSIRLGSWSVSSCHDDLVECRATLAVADRIMSRTAVAAGPVGAMTSILADLGAPLQIVRLHQREVGGLITTFLLCESNGRQAWAAGEGRTSQEASVHALVAAANRLLGATGSVEAGGSVATTDAVGAGTPVGAPAE